MLQPDPPGIRGQDSFFFLHDASVSAFIDGICNDAHVIFVQGEITWVGIFQKFLIFIPAGRRKRMEVKYEY